MEGLWSADLMGTEQASGPIPWSWWCLFLIYFSFFNDRQSYAVHIYICLPVQILKQITFFNTTSYEFCDSEATQHGNFEYPAISKKIMADVGNCEVLAILVHLM
jgi:hypothetical protein